MEQKQCEQCHELKTIDQFRKVVNMYTSVHTMNICKDCYNRNLEKGKQQQAAEWEAGREGREAFRRQQERWQEWQDGREERDRRLEQERMEHRQKLDAWYLQQPDRQCVACKKILPAHDFGFSSLSEVEGTWLPTTLHKRCRPCHEAYRKKNRQVNPLCPMCGTPTQRHDFLREYRGYRLDLIKVCCTTCIPQFEALSETWQIERLRRAMVNAYGGTASIYCLHYDSDTTHHHHIGRTKNLVSRMGEYRRNWYKEIVSYHVLEDLPQGGLSMERESRWMLHALKHGWPIDNFELLKTGEDGLGGVRQQRELTRAVQSFEPLTAPFEAIEPLLKKFLGAHDARIVHWLTEKEARTHDRP